MDYNLTTLVPEALNLYLLNKVWNEPVSEFRENIKPVLLTNISVTGNYFPVSGHLGISLPTGDSAYYVYGLMDHYMKLPIRVPTNVWISATELCNEYRVLFQMFTYSGHMLNKGNIYIKYNDTRSAFIIAVKKDILVKMNKIDQRSELYFSICFDSDIVNKVTTFSYYIPFGHLANNMITEVRNKLENTNNSHQVNLYVNGVELSNAKNYNPKSGDYIDLIFDENIVSEYVVDMNHPENNHLYLSDKDKHYKYVIHTPKALNPDNKVLTRNTCEFYVRRKDTKEALYVHRCADITIGQITHQDYSFPQYIMDSYRDYLGTSDVEVLVKIRVHEKDNVLLRDKNYIDLLYTHDDKTIKEFLTGKLLNKYPTLYFWKASHLEESMYIKYMFDTEDKVTEANMHEYIEGLGYYHVMSIVCERVVHSILTDAFTGTLVFNKPFIYRGNNLLPIVYIDGIKVHQTNVTVTDETDTTITINLNTNVNWKVGSTLTVVFYLDGIRDIDRIKVTATEKEFDFNYDEKYFYLYEEIVTDYTYQGVEFTSNNRYIDLTNTTTGLFAVVEKGNKKKLTFSDDAIGRTFLIYSSKCSHAWSVDIDAKIAKGENIILPLSRVDLSGNTVPVFNFKSGMFYLNGKYLVEGVDYTINTVGDDTGKSFKELILHTFEYMERINNQIEIYLNITEEEDTSYGFVKRDVVYDVTPVNLWFPSISLCHVEGRCEKNLIDLGTHYKLPEGKYPNGAIFEMETSVPKLVKDFLDKYHVNDDKDRLVVLNEYFYGKSPFPEGLLIVNGNHRIYSIFMNFVIRKVIYDSLGFADDPDYIRFKEQLKRYEYVRKADVWLAKPEQIEFIDYYPSYVQYHTDAEKYKIIRRFIEFTMPKDSILSGGDYHG